MRLSLRILVSCVIIVILIYWVSSMWSFAKGVQQDIQKNQISNDCTQLILNVKDLPESQNSILRIVLSESNLGSLVLDSINGKNLHAEVKNAFPSSTIKKEIWQEEGQFFTVYRIGAEENEPFQIMMNPLDSLEVQSVHIKDFLVEDQFGLKRGQTIDSIFLKRPQVRFHSDLHFRIYASVENSKVEYILTGALKALNDSLIIYPDYSVEDWQVEDMKIEALIWRK